MKNTRRLFIIAIVGVLLLIPLLATQFTDEVNWSFFDFLLMGSLLLIVGFLIDFIFKKVNNRKYRILFCVLVIMLFLLFWIELSVGVFGTPFSGN